MKKNILKKIDTIFGEINNFINNEPKEYVFVLYSAFALLLAHIEDDFTLEEITENREDFFKLLYDYVGINDYSILWENVFHAGSGSRSIIKRIYELDNCYDEGKGFDKECLIENFLIKEIEK